MVVGIYPNFFKIIVFATYPQALLCICYSLKLSGFISDNDYIFGKKRVGSLRTFFLVGEFYGLPVELLLFNDLETHGDILKKTYPALFKQSRN
jgi:hypothetical protein